MTSRFGKLIEDAKRKDPEPAPRSSWTPRPVPPLPCPAEARPAAREEVQGRAWGPGRGVRQITAYVRTETRRKVDIALAQEALQRGTKPREFSELVQELLDGWLSSRG